MNDPIDIRTLIFGLGLLNLTLALVVFVYRTTTQNSETGLRALQHAKLMSGLGILLGANSLSDLA